VSDDRPEISTPRETATHVASSDEQRGKRSVSKDDKKAERAEKAKARAEAKAEAEAAKLAAKAEAEAAKLAAKAEAEAAKEAARAGAEVDDDKPRLRWKKKELPGGLWLKCEACGETIYKKTLLKGDLVCPSCSFHFTVPGTERIQMVIDEGTYHELAADITALDRLEFTDTVSYAEKSRRTIERVGLNEALHLGTGEIEGRPLVICVLDFKFMGGSMGEVVGEKIALGCELAAERNLPLVIFTSSGGARMHEGMLSLMQMAKTCAALDELNRKGGFSICIMTNPTTGGVTASFASVCDITLAEPGALIGFAGPRVIATTLKQELPKGFQRAEFLMTKGQIDSIVPRKELRHTLARLIDFSERAWSGDETA
jgi:acetyl-CoA carboxylase carboxyl transferase subunit beta